MPLKQLLTRRDGGLLVFDSSASGPSPVALAFVSLTLILSLAVGAWAAVGGSMSGTVKDQTGDVIPRAMVTVTNTALGTEFKTTSDARGFFSFPSLPVGRYDLVID